VPGRDSRITGWGMVRSIWLGCLALLLAGCVTKSGAPLDGALAPDVAYAYIPLKQPATLLPENDAGAVVLGGGIAVTAAHAADMVRRQDLIGVSHDYDLAFFRTDRIRAVLPMDVPRLGQKIVAYAHYGDRTYHAEGIVKALEAPVLPRCAGCATQAAFAFEGNAGPGYSGGPVLDVESGKLIGIVFGYVDPEQKGAPRLIYAYPMSRVWDELKKAQEK